MFLFFPYRAEVPMNRFPWANILIIALNIVLFFIFDEDERWSFGSKGFNPIYMLTSQFMHADFIHLFGNMVFLWVFGNAICAKFNNHIYIPLYLSFGIIADITQHIFLTANVIGASGAVNGVVGAFLVFYPLNRISMVFIFIVKVYWFEVLGLWLILVFLGFDIWGSLSHGDGVAYFAHLGGFAAGFIAASIAYKKEWLEFDKDEISIFQYLEKRKQGPAILRSNEKSSDNENNLKDNHNPNRPEKWMGDEKEEGKKEELDQLMGKVDSVLADPPLPEKILVICEKCLAKVKASQQYAGLKAKCPKCGADIEFPEAFNLN